MATREDARLKDLCSLAYREQDPQRLAELIEEIDRMIDARLLEVEPRRKRATV